MTWLLPKHDFVQILSRLSKLIFVSTVLSLVTTSKLNASPEEDAKAVAALDTKYQAAVKINDAATMDQILADDFVLVNGRGKVFSKADLIESARKKEVTYERQDEEPGSQKVRVWGDTAVVTALLWIKSCKKVNQPITNFGLAMPMFALQQAGATSSAKHPCHCLKRSPSNREPQSRTNITPSCHSERREIFIAGASFPQ
jgi:ketosteroid isomerase-like protein